MKKHLLLLCFACFCIMASGQNSIPNGDFESWRSGTFYYPQYYPSTSNLTTYASEGLFNVTKVTDAYHGSYAIRLETTSSPVDTSFGYFVNIIPGNTSPTAWHGGMPYDQIPTGISGWYKYNVATIDSGSIIIAFSNGGVNIKTYFFKIGGIYDTYTPFKFTFTPALTQTPDSVEFGALSCKFGPGMNQPLGIPGSVLYMDSVNFTGVTSQPDQMNGDFENWQNQTVKFPNQWYVLSSSDQGTGISQTTDAHEGNYAVELITFLGNQNGQPAAQTAAISTGYFPKNCSGSCNERGGLPYTATKDTLVFWYKYAPSGSDQAVVNLVFKNEGSQISGSSIYLDASSLYKRMELPFEIGQAPDSVIINIGSSNWGNIDLSYVGSDLKIDSIYFKSQKIISGINPLKSEDDGSITVYPNPSTGKIHINSTVANIKSIEIFNVSGEKVYSISDIRRQDVNDLDIPLLGSGIYFIKIYDGATVHTKKAVIR
ncbi:MAG: T9SS type A sorting domain-containing protein [Bacteroidales bacterium]